MSIVTPPPPPPPHHVQAAPKGPQIEVQNYAITIGEPYRFEVRYTVANTGDQPAKKIQLHIMPWRARPTEDIPARKPLDDTSDPRYNEEKIDLIPSLKPGEKIDRLMYFTNDGRDNPIGVQNDDTLRITFEPVGSGK